MHWSPLNVLLELAFAGGLILGLAAMVYAARQPDQRLSRLLMPALAAWVGLYVATVLIVSLTSREVILSRGKPKRFCGFYLDCHLSVAVFNASTTPTLGGAGGQKSERGVFYLLTVRVSNDARRATLTLKRPGVWMVDDQGRRFEPVSSPAAGDGPRGLSQPLLAGTGYPTVLVFDVPRDISRPRLLVTEMDGVWPDRLFEWFLIGDEDSLLHKKTTLAVVDDSHDPVVVAMDPPRLNNEKRIVP
jgi:hypothetical protein